MPNAEDLRCQKNYKGLPDLDKLLEEIDKNDDYIIYGAGLYGGIIYNFLKQRDVKIPCFFDRDKGKQENGFLGLNVISPCISRSKVIVASQNYSDEIYRYLINLGYKKEMIVLLNLECFKNNTNLQYFDPEIITFSTDEVFVDGGSYDFKTSLMLLEKCETIKKIYAFELDPINMSKINSTLSKTDFKNIEIINSGLWSKSGTFKISSKGTGSSVASDGEVEAKVIALDDVVNDKVTFIKMDIEGAELEALKGAEKTIKKHKPKLAICVYHKQDDFIEIPLYIKSLVPEYRLYMRHYTSCDYETVVYAVI